MPVSDEMINKAETILNVKFPESYKMFLRTFGAGCFGCEEIYGVIKNDFYLESIPNVVWHTIKERRDNNLSEQYVPIYYNGGELDFCLDTSQMDKGECPVVIISVGFPEEAIKEYNTFTDFLYYECVLWQLNIEED